MKETRNPNTEARMLKPSSAMKWRVTPIAFDYSDFFRISSFGFRI